MIASRCNHRDMSFRNRSLTARPNNDHAGSRRGSKRGKSRVVIRSHRKTRKYRSPLQTHLVGADDDFAGKNLLDIGGKGIVVSAAAATDLMAEYQGLDFGRRGHPADLLRSGVRFAHVTADAFRIVVVRRRAARIWILTI